MDRHSLKQFLIAFLAGGLVVGAAFGIWASISLGSAQAEKTRLEAVVKKQSRRLDSLSKDQSRLQTELSNLETKKEQGYDQTIGALMNATETADIGALYELGLKALAEKDAPRAYYALAQVHKANPGYKAIETQYPLAQKAYEAHRQSELEALYHKGLDQQASQQFAQAKLSFQQVVSRKPGYKDAKARLAAVSRSLAVRSQTSDLQQKKQWLEASYKLGLNQQALGRLADARNSYAQIVSYAPQYKDAAKRLKALNARLPKSPMAAAAGKPQADSALNELCYSKGIEFAQCAKGGSNPNCAQPASLAPPQCKSHPEFARGIQTVFKQQKAAPADMPADPALDAPDQADEAPAITGESLKGFSDFLKDL